MWIDILILAYGAFCFVYLTYHVIQGMRQVKGQNEIREQKFEAECIENIRKEDEQ